MSLSNTIHTSLHDPTTFTQRRCVFHCPDEYILSELMLLGVGFHDAVTPADRFYPSKAGAYSCIARATLRSGNIVLDELDNVAEVMALMEMQGSNQYHKDASRDERMTGLGYQVDRSGRITANSTDVDYSSAQSNNRLGIANGSDGRGAQISLKAMFPFLAAIDGAYIQNLSVELEWSTNVNHDVCTSANTNPLLVKVPTLMVHSVLGAPKNPEMQVAFTRIINERLYLASTTDGVVQQVNLRSGAFRDRLVKDIIVNNYGFARNAALTIHDISTAQYKERINAIVNGRKLLPQQGIEGAGQKAFYFDQQLSPFCTVASNLQVFQNTAREMHTADLDAFSGCDSITCLPINERIQTLEIAYQRTGTANAHETGQHYISLHGRVVTVVTIDKEGKIMIQ